MDILYRETIGRFLSKFIVYAGYLLIFLTKDNTGLHDMLADTKVIYKNTEKDIEIEDKPSFEYIPIDDNTDECSKHTNINL